MPECQKVPRLKFARAPALEALALPPWQPAPAAANAIANTRQRNRVRKARPSETVLTTFTGSGKNLKENKVSRDSNTG